MSLVVPSAGAPDGAADHPGHIPHLPFGPLAFGLVKAQTGKKLTNAQAGKLTTDADNLATALGC